MTEITERFPGKTFVVGAIVPVVKSGVRRVRHKGTRRRQCVESDARIQTDCKRNKERAIIRYTCTCTQKFLECPGIQNFIKATYQTEEKRLQLEKDPF